MTDRAQAKAKAEIQYEKSETIDGRGVGNRDFEKVRWPE